MQPKERLVVVLIAAMAYFWSFAAATSLGTGHPGSWAAEPACCKRTDAAGDFC